MHPSTMKSAALFVLSSSGRTNRAALWFFMTIFAIGGFMTNCLAESLELKAASPFVLLDWLIVFFGFSVVLTGSVNLLIRRLQDRAKSGHWFLFFVILPLLLFAAAAGPLCFEDLRWVFKYAAISMSLWSFSELFIFPGSDSENVYGKPPVGLTRQQIFAAGLGKLVKGSIFGTIPS